MPSSGKKKLIAPFDGYIGEVYIEKYQDVKATQSVVSFIDITQLKIEAYVTQEIAFQAKEIKEVGIRFDVRPEAVCFLLTLTTRCEQAKTKNTQ